MWLTAPKPHQSTKPSGAVTTNTVFPIIQARCTSCHSSLPTQPGFSTAPQDLAFDSLEDVETHAERIHNVSVVSKTMPLGNLTAMTDEERLLIADWFASLSTLKTQ